MATTTVFRVEKKSNYTIISNLHLQDKALSLKAKGMLTLMLSLPEDWDMTLKGLVALSNDGIDSVRSTIKELEEHGYLSRSRGRNARGQMLCTEYTIHEKSTLTENTENNAENNQVGKSDVDVSRDQVGKSDVDVSRDQVGKSDVDISRDQVGKSDVDISRDQVGFPKIGKPIYGNSDTIKDLKNKKTEYTKDSYPSSYQGKVTDEDAMDEHKAQQLLSERRRYEEIIKENIDYDIYSESEDEDFLDFLNLSVQVMVDAVTSTAPTIRIKKQDIPQAVVKSQLLKVTSEQIEYVYSSTQTSKTKIVNMQNYILTALYNSLFGANLYYSQWVKHDQATASGK